MCVQYTFDITKDDTEVMVSLYQKDARDQRGLQASKGGGAAASKKVVAAAGDNYTIGFHIMKVLSPVYITARVCDSLVFNY